MQWPASRWETWCTGSSRDLPRPVLAYRRLDERRNAVDAWIEAAPVAAPPKSTGDRRGPARAGGDGASIFAGWPTLEVVSVRYAARVLERERGNKSRAARVLDVDRRTLSRLAASSEASKRGGSR